jgi:tRNA uridine 5-carboxymethylaminomethyl modification enzyme
MLRRPDVSYADIAPLPHAPAEVAEQVEIQIKYEGYIQRQREEVARRADFETRALPADLDYREVRGLSAEVQQKLNRHRPETIGQAARISGVTPAAISLLLVHLKRGFRAADKKSA